MDDVEALSTIVSVMRQLDDDARRRVWASVGAFLGVQTTHSEHSTPVLNRQERLPLNRSSSVETSSFSTDRTISPKEFLRDKQPATDVERVACLAYYLTHYRETPHFKTLDISTLNVDAAQPKFSSASVAVDNARAKGLLVPSTKGNKQLSAAGERYVELLPDRDAARESMTSVKRVIRRTRKKNG